MSERVIENKTKYFEKGEANNSYKTQNIQK